ncbi:MAG: hypothetical protein ACPL28_05620 [bacterium]
MVKILHRVEYVLSYLIHSKKIIIGILFMPILIKILLVFSMRSL